jgi:hypothetical protein
VKKLLIAIAATSLTACDHTVTIGGVNRATAVCENKGGAVTLTYVDVVVAGSARPHTVECADGTRVRLVY